MDDTPAQATEATEVVELPLGTDKVMTVTHPPKIANNVVSAVFGKGYWNGQGYGNGNSFFGEKK